MQQIWGIVSSGERRVKKKSECKSSLFVRLVCEREKENCKKKKSTWKTIFIASFLFVTRIRVCAYVSIRVPFVKEDNSSTTGHPSLLHSSVRHLVHVLDHNGEPEGIDSILSGNCVVDGFRLGTRLAGELGGGVDAVDREDDPKLTYDGELCPLTLPGRPPNPPSPAAPKPARISPRPDSPLSSLARC